MSDGGEIGMMLYFTKFTVIEQKGSTDYVMLHTNLPTPISKEISDEPMHLTFEVQRGHGIEYLCEHFDLEPEDINVIVAGEL